MMGRMISIAWRNVWRNKLRSMVIMFSIALGLFAGIAVQALYKGMMKARTRTVIDTETGHIQLHQPGFKADYEPKFILKQGTDLLRKIRRIPGVKSLAARSVSSGMLLTAGGSSGVQIFGINPLEEYRVSQLHRKLVEGSLFRPSKKNQAMIGKKLATKMGLKSGSKMVLMFTDTSGDIVSGAFRIAGIYQSANAPLDQRNIYVEMDDLNALLLTKGTFHEVSLILENDESVPQVLKTLKQKFPGILVESWKELSPETDLMVNTTNQLSHILMVIIMLALAFGIINTMLMAVLERTREIGIMLALGMGKPLVFQLILYETLLLTLAGAPAGIFAGWFAADYYSHHGLDLSGMGKELMSSFGYSTLIYPEFPAEKLPGLMLIVFSTALLSCIIPAGKALSLRPVDALNR